MADKILMQTEKVAQFRRIVTQLSEMAKARMNDMNQMVLTFDQVSDSMFILKDIMNDGLTVGIGIIKWLLM